MSRMNKPILLHAIALLLCSALASGAHGHDGWKFGSQKRQWIEIYLRVLDVRTSPESNSVNQRNVSSSSYLLLHQQGQIVAEGLPGQTILPYQQLWLKSGDHTFYFLAAEERRFREIRLSGLLREHKPDVGILDLVQVDVR